MIQLIIYQMSIMISLIFSSMNHPLAMGLMLLLQTMLICLISGMLTKTFWFSYILFLVFLGGMLVLFIYVSSLASNEMFNLSMKMILMYSLSIIFSIIIFISLDKMIFSQFLSNFKLESISNNNFYLMTNSLYLNKLYNFPNNMMTIMLMIYLLISLVIMVNITDLFFGPLRQMN